MAGISYLVTDISNGNLSAECLSSLRLLVGDEGREEGVIFDLIKNHLSSGEKRWIGICILPVVSGSCRAQDFCKHAGTWIRAMVQQLDEGCSSSVVSLCCRNLSEMLSRSSAFDDISREISVGVINSLMKTLLKISSHCSNADALLLMRTCLLHYPSACAAFREQLENFCLAEVDKSTASLHSVSQVLALLSQCGSGGKLGTKYGENWLSSFSKTMATIDHCLLLLFGEGVDERAQPVIFELLPLQSEDVIEQGFILQRRIVGLLYTLTEMLVNELPFAVIISCNEVINLILDIASSASKQGTPAHILERYVEFHYSAIACALLEFIAVVLLQLGSLVLPYVGTLAQAVSKITRNSGKCRGSEVRVAMYNLLRCWILSARTLPALLFEEVLLICLDDIKLLDRTSKTQLAAAKSGRSKAGKRSKAKFIQEEILQSQLTSKTFDSSENSDVALAALALLVQLTTAGSLDVAPSSARVSVVRRVLAVGLSLYGGRGTDLRQKAPYGSVHCRVKLFEVLYSLACTSLGKVEVPVTLILNLLRLGCADTNLLVAAKCRVWLSFTDAMLHKVRHPYPTLSVSAVSDATSRDSERGFGASNEKQSGARKRSHSQGALTGYVLFSPHEHRPSKFSPTVFDNDHDDGLVTSSVKNLSISSKSQDSTKSLGIPGATKDVISSMESLVDVGCLDSSASGRPSSAPVVTSVVSIARVSGAPIRSSPTGVEVYSRMSHSTELRLDVGSLASHEASYGKVPGQSVLTMGGSNVSPGVDSDFGYRAIEETLSAPFEHSNISSASKKFLRDKSDAFEEVVVIDSDEDENRAMEEEAPDLRLAAVSRTGKPVGGLITDESHSLNGGGDDVEDMLSTFVDVDPD